MQVLQAPKNENHFDFSKAIKSATTEVDLHIEQLIQHHHHLSSSEIIGIQLKACQQALDLAIATHQPTLILIHGIGKGVLKLEIIKLLNQTKHIKSYVNEFDVKYGYGATKVFFQF
ncbi:MAG: Smr/MutS family protein [Bacteroidetes bacterium]|nr:Smr/MutS family protein [Bacteroidota bacterium]